MLISVGNTNLYTSRPLDDPYMSSGSAQLADMLTISLASISSVPLADYGGVQSLVSLMGVSLVDWADVECLYLMSTLTIHHKLEERATASLTAWDESGSTRSPGPWDFEEGQPVLVQDLSANRYFSGVVVDSTANKLPGGNVVAIEHTLNFTDDAYRLDKRVVWGAWLNATLGEQTVDLLNTFFTIEGIREGEIQDGDIIPQTVTNYVAGSAAMDDRKNYMGTFTWFVDEYRKLYFIDRTTYACPWTLTPADGVKATLERTNPKYRNTQYLLGANAQTVPQTEYQVGNGATQTFMLRLPVGACPTINLGSTTPATYTTTGGLANSHIFVERGGSAGNNITFTILGGAGAQLLAVSVTGTAITVQAATVGGNIISVANDIIAAMNTNPTVMALGVQAAKVGTETGTGVVAALAVQSLSGGSDLMLWTPQTVGVRSLDTGMQWYYAVGDNSITQDSSSSSLQAWETLQITYTGLAPIITSAQDVASLGLEKMNEVIGTGEVDSVETDTTLTSMGAASTEAESYLAHYAVRGRIFKCKTLRNDGLAAGQMVTINYPLYNIVNDTFLIDALDITEQDNLIWFGIEAVDGPITPSAEAIFAAMATINSSQNISENVSSANNSTVVGAYSLNKNWHIADTPNLFNQVAPGSSTYSTTAFWPCVDEVNDAQSYCVLFDINNNELGRVYKTIQSVTPTVITTVFYVAPTESVGAINSIGIFGGYWASLTPGTGVQFDSFPFVKDKNSLEALQITVTDTLVD